MELRKEDIKAKVIDLVAEKLNVDKERVAHASSIQDSGADSLDMVEIVMKLEEQFSIEINDEEAEKMTNIDQVVDYIYTQQKK